MHLDVQNELGFVEILDTALAFKAVLDPLTLAKVRQDKEEIINIEGNVASMPLPA